MLTKLRLHNFRTYLNSEINFTPLHLVVGKNNSGKSNLYVAMRFLAATASVDLAKAFGAIPGGTWEATNWSSKSETLEVACECELMVDGKPCTFSYALEVEAMPAAMSSMHAAEPSPPRVTREELHVFGEAVGSECLFRSDGTQVTISLSDHESGTQGSIGRQAPRDATLLSKIYDYRESRYAAVFRKYLSSWLFFSFSPEQMRYGWQGASAEDGTCELAPNGRNLAGVIYSVKNSDERRYRRVTDAVRQIEPSLRAINFLPSPGQSPVPFVELQNRERASWVGLSDGTLRYLACAYLAESVSAHAKDVQNLPVPLVFIEEPENGLFPGKLRSLFELFERCSGQGQFIFTSHSPYFINLYDNRRKSVSLLRRVKDRTEVVALPEPDDGDPDRVLLAEQYSMELFD